MSSDYIPFEIQSEIMKRLPVKSLVQFRSVSKQWKSFIDNPEFIKSYHINHPNPQHHLLVRYTLDTVRTYTSIIDDNTFPQQKFPLISPEPVNSLIYRTILGSVDGLLCFYGSYKDIELETKMVVLWNPSVRKCVGIIIPNVLYSPEGYTRIAFGVCRDTNDPKLVKINVIKTPIIRWEVQVFTLSSHVWKTVYTGVPFKSCTLMFEHVFVDGIIYWSTRDSFILSFDLKSEKLGEVCIPERLVHTYDLCLAKVNESLGLLEYYREGGMSLCGVWMRKDGVNKPFTKIYTVTVEGMSVFNSVLGFRNNGEVVLQLDDDDDFEGSQVEVYEPSSRRINSVGISGERLSFSAWSYMETLVLLDQSNFIIH
ncbi:F-box domain containing protein [Tanacetum coccineum]|uniref:F-box domain containing protein n=1 Tax=Tanacetum coccineum TaxID=301880 RepID=A0ABQ4YTV5_9ASTR